MIDSCISIVLEPCLKLICMTVVPGRARGELHALYIFDDEGCFTLHLHQIKILTKKWRVFDISIS